ncbi:copper homeostasis protein cutC [Verticillium alfalfae VaMs.102]|uniref:Copper homeostasis protein cutC homolog n=1 Tax=Verticillium alfalfae (strain VaMs.102 / ATCC MYA-4576 / FGSC 10136) TaxID=526221 RepID=C9SFI6_VERA1|nr:copper homeostasis protein cutC [Verticillium alfalfae VaMs.102]EEY17972.1 copper homeostasis protein cutC [Verticillium alfalfae VaMs.102]
MSSVNIFCHVLSPSSSIIPEQNSARLVSSTLRQSCLLSRLVLITLRDTITMSPTTSLEIPVFSPAAALHAQSLGAQRIELNAQGSYLAGGLTPTLDDLRAVSFSLTIPNRVMIRPRGPPAEGLDFMYSEAEFEAMLTDVKRLLAGGGLKAERGDGFVFGVLKRGAHGVEADRERNSKLVEAAGGLVCTFHRAFDELVAGLEGVGLDEKEAKVEQAIRSVAACGFDAILTSGGPGRAPANIEILRVVTRKAQGRLTIIIGGGVRSGNIGSVLGHLDVDPQSVWAHSSCLVAGEVENIDPVEASRMLLQFK